MWYYSIPWQHKELSNQFCLFQEQMLSILHPLSLMRLTGTPLNACKGSLIVRFSLPRSSQLRDCTRMQKFPYHIFTNEPVIYKMNHQISLLIWHIWADSISLFANSVQSVWKVKLHISCKRCRTFIKSRKIIVENLSNFKQSYWQK